MNTCSIQVSKTLAFENFEKPHPGFDYNTYASIVSTVFIYENDVDS